MDISCPNIWIRVASLKYTILNAFVLVIFLIFCVYTQQNYEWDIIRNLLKDANNFAVHDAALQVDDIEKSQGRIVFDPLEAKKAFDDTLQKNLGLNDTFQPVPGSRLKHSVEIVKFQLFDESNTSFPFLFVDPEYRIARWIQGPAVFAVVRTDHPKFLHMASKQKAIEVPSIYEIKPNRN